MHHEIHLCVNGIPNDEIYEDKQYMQSVTKQIEKIVDVEKSLQDESLESNILSVEGAMNINEPGNCELHEVPQRTVKEQCPSCQSNVEAGFQVCSCGGKLDMTEDMRSRIRRENRELIESAYMPFQTTRRVKHGVRLHQEHPQRAKDLKRNKTRDDLDPQKRGWVIRLSQNWETYFADNRHTVSWSSTQWHHQTSENQPAVGKPLPVKSDSWRT